MDEPLPGMKRLMEAVEEHWKAMLHAAISEVARQGPLAWYEKAMVEIEVVTARGTDNNPCMGYLQPGLAARFNNLKGVFFRGDDMEHMAFSVTSEWGENGSTIIYILDYERVKTRVEQSDFWKNKD